MNKLKCWLASRSCRLEHRSLSVMAAVGTRHLKNALFPSWNCLHSVFNDVFTNLLNVWESVSLVLQQNRDIP